MNENEAFARLAEANPVQAEELKSLDIPDRSSRRRPPHRRLVLAIAIAAVTAAVVGAFAFNGSSPGRDRSVGHHRVGVLDSPHNVTGMTGPTGETGPTGSHGPTGPLGSTGVGGPTGANRPGSRRGPGFTVRFHRSGPTLTSVDVSVWEFKKTGFELKVRYFGPRGDYLQGGYPVVYRTTVSPGGMAPTTGSVGVGPSGRVGPGPVAWTWSGALSVGDWRGGCQSGDYEIHLDFDVGGAFGVGVSTSEFRCRGN